MGQERLRFCNVRSRAFSRRGPLAPPLLGRTTGVGCGAYLQHPIAGRALLLDQEVEGLALERVTDLPVAGLLRTGVNVVPEAEKYVRIGGSCVPGG